ncbi:unnamed protein product [Chondrus crispus]|uniref:Uncharacterized protein n=1 Tax=Chondrus crispus TaxID=2769 RepID=R7Q6X3_CHOCR|nr:unnamed protein product [Chondrus crispus]CDF33121.1 unnamed protein product [Chondrus crispus]|eukprot:XP_005712923.1 unnamed protein product [Chondrus crispus]
MLLRPARHCARLFSEVLRADASLAVQSTKVGDRGDGNDGFAG